MFELSIIGKSSSEKPKDKKRKPRQIEENSSSQDEEIKTLDSASLLKKVLETVADMVEECDIKASEKGLTIQVMDPMHACISNIFLSKNLFDKYRCDRSLTLGIKIKDFLKILRSLSFKEEYTFQMIAKDDDSILKLLFDCENYQLNFDLTLYTYDLEYYEFPDQKYEVEVEMGTEEFILVPKIVGKFSEHIVLEAKDKTLMFFQGSERANASLTVKEGKNATVSIATEMKKEIAMKYLNCTAKAAMLCEKMKICMGETAPIFFDFELNEGGYLRFFIAPKMEEEE